MIFNFLQGELLIYSWNKVGEEEGKMTLKTTTSPSNFPLAPEGFSPVLFVSLCPLSSMFQAGAPCGCLCWQCPWGEATAGSQGAAFLARANSPGPHQIQGLRVLG